VWRVGERLRDSGVLGKRDLSSYIGSNGPWEITGPIFLFFSRFISRFRFFNQVAFGSVGRRNPLFFYLQLHITDPSFLIVFRLRDPHRHHYSHELPRRSCIVFLYCASRVLCYSFTFEPPLLHVYTSALSVDECSTRCSAQLRSSPPRVDLGLMCDADEQGSSEQGSWKPSDGRAGNNKVVTSTVSGARKIKSMRWPPQCKDHSGVQVRVAHCRTRWVRRRLSHALVVTPLRPTTGKARGG